MSPASEAATPAYSSTLPVTHPPHPEAFSTLALTRDACERPVSVTTGTPIHRASHVVVVPEYGCVSSAMSTSAYARRCSPCPPR